MLVVLPMGLWIFSLAADLIVAAGWKTPWSDLAFYTMAGGLAGALLAAPPGLIDFFSIRDARARRIAWFHMIFNLSAAALFAVNLYLRAAGAPGDSLPVGLSLLSVALLGVGGWLGGELVYVRGVAVQTPPARRGPAELREIPGGKIRRIG